MASKIRRRKIKRASRKAIPSHLDYAVELRKITRGLGQALLNAIMEEWPKWSNDLESSKHPDVRNDIAPAREIRLVLDGVQAEFKVEERARGAAKRQAERVDKKTTTNINAQVKQLKGVDAFGRDDTGMVDLVDLFVESNWGLIKSTTTTEAEQIGQIVQANLIAGKTQKETSAEIMERVDVSTSKANFLARDQTAKLNSQMNATKAGRAGISKYEWSTSRDERVRATHAAHDGQIFSYDDPPADTGAPGIDYNCLPGDSLVQSPGAIKKLWRRGYTSHLTEIITENARVLRSTPNHPVLTQRGWISADAVNIGDYLFKTANEGFNGIEANSNKMEARIDDLFRAASLLFNVKSTAGTEVQFHGDGSMNQNVDIISPDYALRFHSETLIKQLFSEFLLACTDEPTLETCNPVHYIIRSLSATNRIMSSTTKILSFLLTRLAHAQKHSFASASCFYPPTQQVAVDRQSLHSEMLRDLLYAPSLNIELAQDLLRYGLSIGRGTPIPCESDTVIAQRVAKTVGITPERLRDLPLIKTLHVQGTRVIKKSCSEFSGHVYNLQTQCNWYVAQGLVVHNCRCVSVPILDEDEA